MPSLSSAEKQSSDAIESRELRSDSWYVLDLRRLSLIVVVTMIWSSAAAGEPGAFT